ncbi:MAG: hypothetical protein K8R85_00345 [Bacteroidetes bacterium]|nr:hypothetical protein [Bacteroidota bacterium]
MNNLKNNILNNFKNNLDVYLLNYLLIIIYFIVFTNLNIQISMEQFSRTPDSWTYFSTSNEFYKFAETGYSNIRPFLYPLIILIVCKVSGVVGLWLLQFLFWIISINLIYLSIKRITNNKILSFAGSLIIALNITYLVLTFHALTEVTTLFLLSLLIYFISLNAMKINTLKFFHGSLFILVLLSTIKPLFYLLVLLMLFIILPGFYLKKYINGPKNFIILAFIIIPLLLQFTLMKAKYDTFSFSPIGSIGFNYYLFAQGVAQIDGISLDEARIKMKDLPISAELSYVAQNKLVYASLYFQNMKANIKAVPCFLLYPGGFPSGEIAQYMIFVNSLYYYIHIIFIIPILISVYSIYKRKNMSYYLGLIIISCFLISYIFLTLPIIFGEGDRYVLVSLPLWVFLYSLILNYLFKRRTPSITNARAV